MATLSDPAADVLLLPLAQGELAWPAPGRSLFLRARAGAALGQARAQAPVCEQGFKPWADALARGKAVRLALNQDMVADESAPLPAGAEVAFFPPVTGG